MAKSKADAAAAPESLPPIVLRLLAQVGVPLDEVYARLNEYIAKWPDMEVPIQGLINIINPYLNKSVIERIAELGKSEIVAVVLAGKGPVSHDPVDLA